LTLDSVIVSFLILQRELPAWLVVTGFEKVTVCRRVSGIAHNNWHRMSTHEMVFFVNTKFKMKPMEYNSSAKIKWDKPWCRGPLLQFGLRGWLAFVVWGCARAEEGASPQGPGASSLVGGVLGPTNCALGAATEGILDAVALLAAAPLLLLGPEHFL